MVVHGRVNWSVAFSDDKRGRPAGGDELPAATRKLAGMAAKRGGRRKKGKGREGRK